MKLHVTIQSGILNLPTRRDVVAGAVVSFAGVVRAEEEGRSIEGLEYEAYQPMAERQMTRILEELGQKHPCLEATVLHRIGFVPAGEVAIWLEVRAGHRAEAFALAEAFMDQLKRDVPIWKSGARWKQAPNTTSHHG